MAVDHDTPLLTARAASGAGMALSVLASHVPGSVLHGDAGVAGVCVHTGRIRPGDLFVAIPGIQVDGHDYAAQAVDRGAAAIAVERRLPIDVPQLVVPSARGAAGPLAAAFHGFPSTKLSVVGITGTNGKTTTCEVVRACLESSGRPAGQICSTGVHIGNRFTAPSDLTTPEAPDLQATLAELVAAGGMGVALEVSSHGLELGRIDGIDVDVGVFLGLTPEHLDFHGTMERYLHAKGLLFDPSRCARAVVCVDSEWGRRLADACTIPVTTFGHADHADVRMSVNAMGLDGFTVELAGATGPVTLRSPIVGAVNATNVVAAYLAACAAGVRPEAARAAVARCGAPPGRFELVSDGDPFRVVIDYAHTPDALDALIETCREVTPGKLHLVLGARGDRYSEKRAEMARVASHADTVTFATDSPGSEDPRHILGELRDNVPDGSGSGVSIDVDRTHAIRQGVRSLEPGDTLLITGRGHETSQRFGEQIVPCDDRVVARLALGARRAEDRYHHHRVRAGSVTVVIPVHNGAATIDRALRSVLSQTATIDEIIVVDDGSTDGSVEAVRAFGPGIALIQQRTLGPSAARNAGIAMATSEWIALLDADDEWMPEKIEEQLRAVARQPGVVLCATDWSRHVGTGTRTPRRSLATPTAVPAPTSRVTARSLLLLNRFQTSTVLARRSAMCAIGGFDSAVDGAEDWDCWIRVAALGAIVKVDRPLVRYADTPDGYSKDLRRHHQASMRIVGRELSRVATAGGRQVRAWHHLRFAIAFRRLGDMERARHCLADIRRERLLGASVPASVRYVMPFVARRLVLKARPVLVASTVTTRRSPGPGTTAQ